MEQIEIRDLYNKALAFEKDRTRIYDFERNHEEVLTEIKDEILIRLKISQAEIYTIGELLCLAKRNCQQSGMKFQPWIADNFDFSYESAKNFMSVYKHCMGIPYIVTTTQLPTTILYRVCSDSFPDDLREYLLTSGLGYDWS